MLTHDQILSHKHQLPGHIMRHSVAAALLDQGFDVKLFGTGAAMPVGGILQAVAEFRCSGVESLLQTLASNNAAQIPHRHRKCAQ